MGGRFERLVANRKCVLVTQLCLTLCDPMDCSPPGFSVQEIVQARMLEWVPISFCRGSSQTRNQTQVFRIAGRLFFYCLSHQGGPANWKDQNSFSPLLGNK